MNIITANVGQGALSIVRHGREAIIVDSRIPPSDNDTVCYVKEMLAVALKDHNVKGLILTGFDSDHADVTGVGIILPKYRPDWVMYPKYYKESDEAKRVFSFISQQEAIRRTSGRPLQRISVRLDRLNHRQLLGLSSNFEFELFSPHVEDMDCSNNCSIVLKLTGIGDGGFSYLITGDTENGRWDTISKFFGTALKSHVLAAPHHGSRHSVHPQSLLYIEPHTVLVSAGVNNQYGHPSPEALKVYDRVARHVYSTNMQNGVSLLTKAGQWEIETSLISSK